MTLRTPSRKVRRETAHRTAGRALVTALAHPTRVAILRALADRSSSPKRLADRLDEPLGNISHHVRILRDAGLVEEIDRRQVRGAYEHFYALAGRTARARLPWRRPAAAPGRAPTGR